VPLRAVGLPSDTRHFYALGSVLFGDGQMILGAEPRSRAELLDASGHVVDTVEVALESSSAGPKKLREWSGTIDKAAATGPAWKVVARIRLNGGREGQVNIAGDYIGSGSRFGLIRGIGPAPF
jgi:hypothetical protein